MTFGAFSKFQLDDYLMMLALAFYTVLIPCINIVRDNDSNLLPEGFDVSTLTPEDIADRTYGSKMILVVEQCQCVVVWLAKACLLILYLRLTTMRTENLAIKLLLAYVAVSFVVMDILYFGVWCQPFHNYWAVPTPDPQQCSAATNHLILNAVFNLTSDTAMLVIGLPMFLRLNLPWHKKVPVVGVFSLGIFTVLAAILNKVYSFTDPFGSQWTYWYIRESSTALIVANLPFVWTLWRKLAGFEPSIHGVSRHNSGATAGTAARASSSRRGSTKRRLSSWFRRGTAPDLELDPPPRHKLPAVDDDDEHHRLQSDDHGPEMSAADFFALDAPRLASTDAPPDPITHPHLFYARQKASLRRDDELPEMDMAVLNESPARETLRRGDEEGRERESALPSLTSSVGERSAEGFV